MNLNTSHEIKKIQSQITSLRKEADAINSEIKVAKERRKGINDTVSVLNKRLKEIERANSSTGELVVSEHAFLRYLERVKGMDLEKLQSEIVTDMLKNTVSTLGGTGSYPADLEGSFKAVIKNFTYLMIARLNTTNILVNTWVY